MSTAQTAGVIEVLFDLVTDRWAQGTIYYTGFQIP